ncbi:Uncharacterised protein [Vibrio cholerae]|uniref:Uncharacterized protein n=1 Tax=Vibrio cholerae TaxID=666 RepID=A0A655TC49_VIBCL|nr:Uncharacterised protein [Vibrio cholerae]CSA52065.1 Uncharacterised protein [Vibrio cholerae]CSB33811.1 Uncharacterised protein [Vibrio cholerae]CSB74020.1 Uncharacterised protein [Vibrio cholerae]CSC37332.1 Uncharacterised protein [Vibrio cholerae]
MSSTTGFTSKLTCEVKVLSASLLLTPCKLALVSSNTVLSVTFPVTVIPTVLISLPLG